MNDKVPAVYSAIAEVMAAISKTGISKDNKNVQQGYKFRGIDDVYNALAPLLSESKLLILPRVLSRTITERETKNGGVLFYVVLDVEFDFVAALDASLHTVRVIGEAMDTGDKASNKAMSSAYKYACMEAFCIPTEGDNDADATTHEVKTKDDRDDSGKPEGWRSQDTRKVTEYRNLILDAVGEGADLKAVDIWLEVKDDKAFATALWVTLPSPIKTMIRLNMPQEAA